LAQDTGPKGAPLVAVARVRSRLLATMKMMGVLCALMLCNVFVDGHQFLGVEEPAASTTVPPLEGPAHEDNFQDEVVDQADHEFDMISGGDDCVSWEDLKKSADAQFDEEEDDYEPPSPSAAEKEENEKIKAVMLDNLEMEFGNADSDKDGCVSKAEFKAAGETEGPSPGFEKTKLKDMSEDELTEEMNQEDRLEFDAMDKNNDTKVSESEAYDYASGNMPAADINSEDLDEMFKACDTDGDGFITFEEFQGAGQEIEGDGNEMKHAKSFPTSPPKPMAGGINFKVFMLKRKIANVRMEVTKKSLAHKPPLKFMSRLLNRRK